MSKIYNSAIELIERVKTLDAVESFFWGVMFHALAPADRSELLERLIDKVAKESSEVSK